MNVLVVDDSATMRRIVTRTLGELGRFEFFEAENGHQALEVVEKGGIDLVITDWNMPIMNGLEFVTQLRDLNSDLPVLMLTTNASDKDVIQALKAGVNNYIVKPFAPNTLKEKVTAILDA